MNNGSKLEIVLAGQAVAAFRDERDLMETAPARIAEWDALAKRHAADAARLALAIGGTLLAVRDKLPHGAFLAWVATNCGSVTVRTAQKYMRLAAARAAADQLEGGGDAEGAEAAKAERDFGQTLTKLYIDYGVLKPRGGWGGDTREQAAKNGKRVGRPAKNPDLSEDARKSWTLALESFRKMPDTSYRFVPLGVAEGVIAELNAVCDKLAARIAELKKAEE